MTQTNETPQPINVDKVIELVEKLADKDENISLLRADKKKLIDEYTQFTGVPNKKTLSTAISLAKKKGVDKDDLTALVELIEPIVMDE